MTEDITEDRPLAGVATMTIRAGESSTAKPAALPPIKPGTNTSFASLKQIDAGVLAVVDVDRY
jgi:hypothetical protein